MAENNSTKKPQDSQKEQELIELTGHIFAKRGMPKHKEQIRQSIKECGYAARMIINETPALLEEYDKELNPPKKKIASRK